MIRVETGGVEGKSPKRESLKIGKLRWEWTRKGLRTSEGRKTSERRDEGGEIAATQMEDGR